MNRAEYLRNYYKENKQKMNDRRLENYYHSRYGITSDKISQFQNMKSLKKALKNCSADTIDFVRENLVNGSPVEQILQTH
jgi:hypothetical protein